MPFEELRESLVKKIEDQEELARIDACHSVEELDAWAEESKERSEKLMTAKQFCYLKDLTYKGAHLRYGAELSEEVEKRIRYELSTIEWMGFRVTSSSYGTISARLAKWACRSDRAVVRSRIGRGLLSENYQHRSAEIRPAVRAFPQPRAYLAARCRRRLR